MRTDVKTEERTAASSGRRVPSPAPRAMREDDLLRFAWVADLADLA
jgi:hypothetical protein